MKMGIDLDETILSHNSLIYKLLNIFFPLKLSSKKLKYDIIGANDIKQSNLIMRLILKFLKIDDARYYYEISDACRVIRQEMKNGNEIYLLSSRPNLHGLTSAIITWNKLNDLPFSYLVVGCNNKIEFCKKFGLDLLIDNSLRTCKYANKNQIPSICLTKNSSKKIDKCSSINLANNWIEIENLLSKIKSKNLSS